MKNKNTKRSRFLDYVVNDALAGIDGITHRAMFSGYGIYKNGVIFAIIAYSRLYFKTDRTNQANFEKLGSQPFTYSQGKSKSTTLSYWELPVEIMEDRKKIKQWVDKSVQISKRNKK
ncbi:MAG: TfoX/Sxy family protein [Patescibacteria group bacterium]